MKKYLLLGLVLILANGFTSARAQSCINNVTISNSSGSPPVVVGNAVQILVTTSSVYIVDVYLDGNLVLTFYPSSNPGAVSTTLTVAYGNHTLQGGTCPAFDFSVVAPPATPGTPALSSSKLGLLGGGTYTLSWTVPSGSINHYTLSRSSDGETPTLITLPGSSTSDTFSASSKAGTDNTIDYMVRACASSDESDCGAWSNTIQIVVIN